MAAGTPVAAGFEIPNYSLGERIGAGGFGEVYRATHLVLKREVAVKVLNDKYSADPEAVTRFVAEARAVSQLSHPGIVDLFEIGALPDGRQFFVMELLRGKTLREVLRERPQIPLDEALPILRAIAEALDAAHAAGIAHRDLKPDNVFIVDGGVKLIDFGLAKLSKDLDAPVTRTGSLMGTPMYMSPEQCRGRATTVATDAYSFGVVAYQMLVGAPPFEGEPIDLALHHLNDEPETPSKRNAKLNERVDRVLMALLAKDLLQRPMPLAGAVTAIIEGVLPPKPRKRRVWLRFAPLIAVGGIAGAIALRSTPVVDACATPSVRLTGIWDEPTRLRLGAQLSSVGTVEASAAWNVVAKQFDGFATSWSKHWVDACHADKKVDPLLYEQRINCVDRVLLSLQASTSSMLAIDPAVLAQTYAGDSGLQSVSDCDSAAVLRALPPAPTANKRKETTAVLVRALRVGRDLHEDIALRKWDRCEALTAELRDLATQLEAIDEPTAVEVWAMAAQQEAQRSSFAHTFQRANELVQKTITLGGAVHADAQVATAYIDEAAIRVSDNRDLDSITEALARAREASTRAGEPIQVRFDLARIQCAVNRIYVDDFPKARLAVYDLQKVSAQLDADFPAEWANERAGMSAFYTELGAYANDKAVEVARSLVAHVRDVWGPQARGPSNEHYMLFEALLQSGAYSEAIDELRVLVRVDRPHNSVEEIQWAELTIATIAFAIKSPHAELDYVALRADAPQLPLSALDNITMGALDLAAHRLGHEIPSTDAERQASLEARTALAFVEGRYTEVPGLAARSIASAREQKLFSDSGRYLAVALALNGDKLGADRALAAIDSHITSRALPSDPAAELLEWNISSMLAHAAIALSLGAPRDAVALLEELRTYEKARLRDINLAETDALLGRAYLEAGDATAAAPVLEESLRIVAGVYLFVSFTPDTQLALAQAIALTHGDMARARGMATVARNLYRTFLHREDRALAAQKFLDAHPN